MKEKFVFIVNPKAGKKAKSLNFIEKIESICKELELDSEIYITRSGGDAREYVKNYCKELSAPVKFYACGGDGTMNEVINGAVGCKFASVGIIPLGSGNDYIKAFKDADFMDLKLQVASPSVPVDLIRIGDRYVANMCNIGFDATVAHNFVKFKSIPGVSGKLAYAISVFYCLIHKISTHMDIVIDDETTISDNMLLCSVSKGIYCGGQYRTAPKADVSDGFMDILPIKKITRPQFLKFFKHYKNGTHIESPALQKYVTYLKCKKAEIKGAKNLPVCFDGDTAFLDGDVVFELVKDAVNVIVPAKNVAECQKEAVQAL